MVVLGPWNFMSRFFAHWSGFGRISTHAPLKGGLGFMDCGGKRSATPLSQARASPKAPSRCAGQGRAALPRRPNFLQHKRSDVLDTPTASIAALAGIRWGRPAGLPYLGLVVLPRCARGFGRISTHAPLKGVRVLWTAVASGARHRFRKLGPVPKRRRAALAGAVQNALA